MVLCKFLINGILVHTIKEYTLKEKKDYINKNYFEISNDDLALYETLQYRFNFETKQPNAVLQSLDIIKAVKLAALKAERDNKEVAPIEYNGYLYDYDDKARDRINAAIIALELAGAEASLEWTCADNTDATVTAADLKNIIAAVAVRSNALHVAYRTAKTAVEAAQSKEELEAIVLEK